MLSRTFIDKLRNMILPMQFAAQLQIMNDIKTKMGDSDGVISKGTSLYKDRNFIYSSK